MSGRCFGDGSFWGERTLNSENKVGLLLFPLDDEALHLQSFQARRIADFRKRRNIALKKQVFARKDIHDSTLVRAEEH